jgi:ROK family
MPYLGIDVGGTSVKIAMVESDQVLWTGQSQTYSRPITRQLSEAIRQAAAGREMRADAVGLCVPGLLDKEKRMITHSVNVPGLNQVNLDELIHGALGNSIGAIHLINDAVATGYDIYTTQKPAGRLLVLAIGTGIGMSVLDDGRPLYVEGESPGHIGQVDVSVPGHPVVGPDNGAGSLEGYLGVPPLIKRYGPDLPSIIPTLKGDEPPFLALAKAIRITHAIYRPHHYRLAGGIGIRLGHILPRLRQVVEDGLSNVARSGWTLDIGGNDFHAACGAGKLARMRT